MLPQVTPHRRRRGRRLPPAALREAAEGIGLDRRAVTITGRHVLTCGGWRYMTVIGTQTAPLTLRPNHETARGAWVPAADVAALPLHPGFRAAWDNGLAQRV